MQAPSKLCYVMLCYVMLCYVMLCYVTMVLTHCKKSWTHAALESCPNSKTVCTL